MPDSDGPHCRVCGKKIKFCKSCETTSSWKRVACCEQHRDIRKLFNEYSGGSLTKKQVRDSLMAIGVYDGNGFLDVYRDAVNKVFEPDPKPKKQDEYHPVAASRSVKRSKAK